MRRCGCSCGPSMLTQAPTAWLHFKSGPMTGHTMPLESGVTSLGRAEDNDVVIDDATVSRRHAQIKYQDGQYFVEACGGLRPQGGPGEGEHRAAPEGREQRKRHVSGRRQRHQDTSRIGGSTPGGSDGDHVHAGNDVVIDDATGGSASPNGMASSSGVSLQGPGETVVMDQPQSVMAWLAVTAGPQKGMTYQLKIGDNTIGREGCDLVIEDTAVSRRHAMIKVQGANFLLIDTGSLGGTRVGGKSLGGKIVNPGSVISLGQTRLTFHGGGGR